MKHLVIDCRMYGEKYGGIGRYVKEIVNHIIKDNFKLTLLCGLEAYEDLKGVQSIHLIKMNSSIFSIQEQFELFFKMLKPGNKKRVNHYLIHPLFISLLSQTYNKFNR